MRVETRFIGLIAIIALGLLIGCSGGGSSSPPPGPDNNPPVVNLVSTPPDTIFPNQNAIFSWSGSDPDGDLAQYFTGLNGNFTATTNQTVTYSSLTQQSSYTFKVFAVDSTDLHSDTASYTFYVREPKPTVALVSTTPPYIHTSVSAEFTWSGTAPGSSIAGYYAGLNGDLDWTTNTSATYSGLAAQADYRFQVVAQNANGATSDTASFVFDVVTEEVILFAFGQGLTDTDGDGFWSDYAVRWSPVVTVQQQRSVRLVTTISPTFGTGSVIIDSTAVETRNFGQTDTLTYTLPALPKDLYDIETELHDNGGQLIVAGPSLSQISLENIEGFYASFNNAWTADAVDSLPVGAPDGYYESIDVWWSVSAYPDAGSVKVVVYERNETSGLERWFHESQLMQVNGFGTAVEWGVEVIAGTDTSHFSYRLRLLDQNNNLLDEMNYGEAPALLNIPIGLPQTSDLAKPNRARSLER
jgi:hypothetical protein